MLCRTYAMPRFASAMTTVMFLVIPAVSSSVARAAQPPVGLGTAGAFALVAGSSGTDAGPSTISGNLGLTPGPAVIGFGPLATLNGSADVADAPVGVALFDLKTAYDDAAGWVPAVPASGNLGGLTLTSGVYRASSSLGLAGPPCRVARRRAARRGPGGSALRKHRSWHAVARRHGRRRASPSSAAGSACAASARSSAGARRRGRAASTSWRRTCACPPWRRARRPRQRSARGRSCRSSRAGRADRAARARERRRAARKRRVARRRAPGEQRRHVAGGAHRRGRPRKHGLSPRQLV